MQYNIENKTLICIGDVHGEFSTLRYKLSQYIKKYNLTDTIFIVCGDCGFFGKHTDNKWFYHERSKINKILVNSGNELYFFRGNHDNPEFFDSNTIYIVGNTTTIKVLKDYDILNSNLYGRILVVPGATSVDRYYRTKDVSWWENEGIKKLSNNELNKLGKIDLVLSHSLPYFPKLSKFQLDALEENEIHYKGANFFNQTLSVTLYEEQLYLQNLQLNIKASSWISGHYHVSSVSLHENSKYVCIDIMEFYEPSYN